MSLKDGVKRQSGANVLFLIMIVAVLLFAYYGVLGRDLQEGLNIPQVSVANNAGRGSPGSWKKMNLEKSSPQVDSSGSEQAEPILKGVITQETTKMAAKIEKSNNESNEGRVSKSKRISRIFEVLKQSNLVIEEILLQER